jgi:preprotein translocase subunit SecA
MREKVIDDGPVDELVGTIDPRWRGQDDIVRHCTLAALDQAWREHLGVLTEARDGIYLRSLGGDHPVDAFTKIAVAEFAGFFEGARQLASEMIGRALVDGLNEDTLNRPSSTWTYMSDDDPFGSSSDRFVQNFGRLVHGRRQ